MTWLGSRLFLSVSPPLLVKSVAMNDQILDRLEQLERSVRRWRLATLVFAVLLVCSIAAGGTVNLMLMLEMPAQRELMMQAEEERDRAAVERAHAEKVRQQAEEGRREMEAAKNDGNPP